MTTETEERNPDNNPPSTKRKESESQPGLPRRAGRGRRNSRSGGRRGGGGSSESAGEGKLGQRDGKSDSKSGNATKEGGSELGRRRRGQQGAVAAAVAAANRIPTWKSKRKQWLLIPPTWNPLPCSFTSTHASLPVGTTIPAWGNDQIGSCVGKEISIKAMSIEPPNLTWPDAPVA